MKRPDSFEECCQVAGVNPKTDPVLSLPDSPATIASKRHRRLEIIGLALNGDWVADMSDTKQRKYFPWHVVTPDSSRPCGFRLSCYNCDCDDSGADLGSRLYYKDADTAIHAGTKFIEYYEDAYSPINQ